ncbi:hypothetical protein [Micromonospora arborensis]|uniref:hypothetical protein n=1 Tax=Micromonospora arborensis TaxID=2116518 RepID=UPI0037160F16
MRVAVAAVVAVGGVSLTVPAAAQARVDGVVSYADAVPGLAPAGGLADQARYVDENGREIDPAANRRHDGGNTPSAIGCTPVTLPDDPHWSSPDVSGHGQWNKGDCTGATAHVTNCLYEYYTDGTWRRKACSDSTQLKPKSESNNRSTARRTCDSTGALISWRNQVDVDVDGQVDSSGTEYHQASVYCVVTGADQ